MSLPLDTAIWDTLNSVKKVGVAYFTSARPRLVRMACLMFFGLCLNILSLFLFAFVIRDAIYALQETKALVTLLLIAIALFASSLASIYYSVNQFFAKKESVATAFKGHEISVPSPS